MGSKPNKEMTNHEVLHVHLDSLITLTLKHITLLCFETFYRLLLNIPDDPWTSGGRKKHVHRPPLWLQMSRHIYFVSFLVVMVTLC